MNYLRKRVADRKLTCARCQKIGRGFGRLEACRELIATKSLAPPESRDAQSLPEWIKVTKECEEGLVGETPPETWDIKRGEECLFVELSGTHYLHLECAEKYLRDLTEVLEN